MQRNMIETILGAVVLLIAGVFVVFAYTNASLQTPRGYSLTAHFDQIGDLKKGDVVRLSGIRVGTVTGQRLDLETYQAIVTLTIEHGVRLPVDTSAEITSEGLMGGAHILLSPGASDRMLADGDRIRRTQGAVSLMDLIGRAMFSPQGGLDDAGLGPRLD